MVAVGCGSQRHLPPVMEAVETHKDSTVINVRDSVVVKLVYNEVPIPSGSASAVAPPRDTSHVETDLAESDAFVDSTGVMHHSINNKPGTIMVPVPSEEHWHEELTVQDRADESTRTETVTIEVEKELTQWQRAWIALGKFFLVLCAAALSLAIMRKRR